MTQYAVCVCVIVFVCLPVWPARRYYSPVNSQSITFWFVATWFNEWENKSQFDGAVIEITDWYLVSGTFTRSRSRWHERLIPIHQRTENNFHLKFINNVKNQFILISLSKWTEIKHYLIMFDCATWVPRHSPFNISSSRFEFDSKK